MQKLVRIRFGCGLDSRIYSIYILLIFDICVKVTLTITLLAETGDPKPSAKLPDIQADHNRHCAKHCELVWALASANFCDMQQRKTTIFAAHCAGSVFQNLKRTTDCSLCVYFFQPVCSISIEYCLSVCYSVCLPISYSVVITCLDFGWLYLAFGFK